MSNRICKRCKSANVVVDGTYGGTTYYRCKTCGQWGDKDKFTQQTVFQRITQSPEVLAEKLVFNIPFVTVGGAGFNRWYSTIEPFDEDIYYYTKAEAIAATVAKLKEVCDD